MKFTLLFFLMLVSMATNAQTLKCTVSMKLFSDSAPYVANFSKELKPYNPDDPSTVSEMLEMKYQEKILGNAFVNKEKQTVSILVDVGQNHLVESEGSWTFVKFYDDGSKTKIHCAVN
jgi:hypothetical protein